MSDRYHRKPPEFTPETAQTLIYGNRLRPELYEKAKTLTDYFLKESQNYVQSLADDSYWSVYIGYSGLALTHFMMHLKQNRPGSLQIAKQLNNMALRRLRKRTVSFLEGDAGPLALAAAINFVENNPRKAMQFVEELMDLGKQAKNQDFEVLYGWAGYLYALLYVNTFVRDAVPGAFIRKVAEKIIFGGYNNARSSRSPVPLVYSWHDTNYYGAAHGVAGVLYMLLVVEKMLSEGTYNSRKAGSGVPLVYTWDNTNYCGAAHGVAGILYMLLCSGVVSHSEMHDVIKPTLDNLIYQRFPSGNYRSSEDSNSDNLVQWCHGAPGFTDLLLLAYEMFGGSYLDLAEDSTRVVWERGLLKKGYSICHGVSGNAYSFLSMYKKTMSQEQLYRAATYFHWTLTYPEYQGYKPDRPFSLFEGQAGVLYFLTEMEDPSKAEFPGYHLL